MVVVEWSCYFSPGPQIVTMIAVYIRSPQTSLPHLGCTGGGSAENRLDKYSVQ